jgi:hypothetical protein
LPGNNQRAQKDIASLKGFGTKAGCISSIDQSGTPSFQEQSLEDLEEAAKRVWNSDTGDHLDDYIANAKQDSDHFNNCLEDIPLKDKSKVLLHY